VVVNAATTEKDLAWLQRQAQHFDVTIAPRRDLGMIAVQGPNAREKALPLLPEGLQKSAGDLEPFSAASEGDIPVAWAPATPCVWKRA